MKTLLIIDLEATCCNKSSIPKNEMEIIEIGAVAVNKETFEIVDEYSTFIKPVRNPILRDFCKELTTIKQNDVDKSLGFKLSIGAFKSWFYSFEDPVFCSWGYYDKSQFIKDCIFHKVEYPFR